jgi:replicative DNA helicase
VDVERHLLSKVLEDKNLHPLLDHRITPEFFEDDEHRKVFEWMLNFYAEYTELPTIKAVRNEFPDWKPIEPTEPLVFYIDEVRKAREYVLLHNGFVEARKQLGDRDTTGAKATLATALTQVNVEVAALRDFELNSSGLDWLDEYLALPEGLIGIPTGFPTIDYATNGLQPEQLVTVIGLPKAGKSTLIMAIANNIVLHGKRAMVASFEMSAEEKRQRYYAMVGRINFEKLLNRTLNPVEREKLRTALRQREAYPDFIVSTDITAGTTVGGLQAKVEQYQPDVLVVDGVYLMDSEVPGVDGMDPRALTALTRNLKRLAQRLRIPVVITHQGLESRYSKKTGLTTRTIGYSSSFAQDSDVILGCEWFGETETDQTRRLSILAGRNTRRRSCLIDWDWETSSFTEMEGYDEVDPDTIGDEFDA